MPLVYPRTQGFVRHVVVAGIGDGDAVGREAIERLDGVKAVAAGAKLEVAPGALLAFVIVPPGRTALQAARALRDHDLPVVGIAYETSGETVRAAADVAGIFEAVIAIPDAGTALSVIRCVADPIANPGLINIASAEVRELFRGMGPAVFSAAEAEGPDCVGRAADAALSRSRPSRRAWINLEGGTDLSLGDFDTACSRIRRMLAADANAVIACSQKAAMTGRLRVSIIAAAGD